VIRFILIAILLLLIARIFWKVIDNVLEAAGVTSKRGRRAGSPPRAPAVRLVRDPVCGTHVAPNAALSLSAGGTTHYFCSQKCHDEYRRQTAAGNRR
jgi:YHS domain-containing protein